jgi:hypothetical protein
MAHVQGTRRGSWPSGRLPTDNTSLGTDTGMSVHTLATGSLSHRGAQRCG